MTQRIRPIGYDVELEVDALYPQPPRNNVRRYRPVETRDIPPQHAVIRPRQQGVRKPNQYDTVNVYVRQRRITQAPRPQEASRQSVTEQDDTETDTEPLQARSQRTSRRRVHWLVSLGCGMVAMLLLWIVGTFTLSWWQGYQKDGHPRTFQCDASAVNGAFHGGQNARTYQSVPPQEINTVTSGIKSSLEQSVQAALQTQVQASETLLTPLSCTSKVTPDHQPGEEATQVQVTVSQTCTGTTYTTQAVTSLTTQRATQDANARLGTGYTTTGVQSCIVKTTPSTHGTLDLQVQSISLWAYSFNQEQQESIKATITGLSRDKATTAVLHMTGVQNVCITLKKTVQLFQTTNSVSASCSYRYAARS